MAEDRQREIDDYDEELLGKKKNTSVKRTGYAPADEFEMLGVCQLVAYADLGIVSLITKVEVNIGRIDSRKNRSDHIS